MRAVLAAAVGVEDNTAGALAPPERHAQGIVGEFGRHPFGHGPACVFWPLVITHSN